MTPEQWHRVKEVFEAALGHAPEERSAFLNQACAEDESVRSEVESLLSSYSHESDFMESPAAALAAHSLLTEESAALDGRQLGHFQIDREIGRGGMGVVYLAQDLSLGRPVALKLLPGHLTSDPSRLRRFEREARAASALNHPNILTIYEIAQLDGLHSIAAEFVDGVTLRERIKSKQLQLSEALNIAEQIASALLAAHEAGIVHRDIKPENVMLRRDGYVKVLDFGLAKLTEHEAIDLAKTSVSLVGMTDTGVMGTVGYMSPEQAEGFPVDKRTDIFSLGVVMYEMITGHPPFPAKTTGMNIRLNAQPEPLPLTHYLPDAPAQLQLIVTRTLRQDREQRYQTMAELLADLKNLRSKPTRKRFPARRLTLTAATFSVVVGSLLWFYSSRGTGKSTLPPMKILPFTTYQGDEYLPSFSPDGNKIAFVWTGENQGPTSIYVKQIGSEKLLRLTSDPTYEDGDPVWSPDGQKIAFVRSTASECQIFIVDALGGEARKLVTLGPNPGWPMYQSLAWSPDGKYIATPFTEPNEPHKIFLISLDGTMKQFTSPPAKSLGDFNPAFSPDGHSLAFFRTMSMSDADIYVVPTTGGEPKRLTFDNAFVEGLDWTADGREIVFSSHRGSVATNSFASALWRIPASGGTPERIPIDGIDFWFLRIARQGDRLTFVQFFPADWDIYRIEISPGGALTKAPIKLISSTQLDASARFSPDGRQIAFNSDRSGRFEVYLSDIDGRNVRALTSSDPDKRSGSPSWSPDGKQIAFDVFENNTGDIYAINVDGGAPRPIATYADSSESLPSWSRDGKWIYFNSDRTGRLEVWKAPAEGGEAVQVTRGGGLLAHESFDGKYVYYLKPLPTQGIWRVPVHGGEEVRIVDSYQTDYQGNWEVTKEGIYFINDLGRTAGSGPEVSIDFFDFATLKTKQIANLGKVSIVKACLSVSPDGRQILYTQNDQHSADITLVENFR